MPIFRDENRRDGNYVYGQDSVILNGSSDYTITSNSSDWIHLSGGSDTVKWTENFISPTQKLTQSQKLKLQGKL